MNRLIGVLFVAAATCASAAAPEGNNQSNAPATVSVEASQSAQQQQAMPANAPFDFKPAIQLRFEPSQQGTARRQRREPAQPSILIAPPVIAPPQFVVKNGAVYLDVLGNGVLVPAPGGGASGCFNSNLHARIEKLKTVIEALPPRPERTPVRQ